MKTHLKCGDTAVLNACPDENTRNRQTACGYMRDDVTSNKDAVDCRLCLQSEQMKHYFESSNSK